MARTWWSLVMALVLVSVSATIFIVRQLTQEATDTGLQGEANWKVTLVVSGELRNAGGALFTVLPLDFRQQHIFDERFQSKELTQRLVKSNDPARRVAVWRPLDPKPQPIRLSYSFRCVTGVRHPGKSMEALTAQVDAPSESGTWLKPSALIESDHEDIFRLARELADDRTMPADQVLAFFEHVVQFENEPQLGSKSALDCLHNESGDAGAKSRLLVALCRNRGIPARLVAGLILQKKGDQEQSLHYWAEAWVNEHWLPMCPTHRHFGPRLFPRNYLVIEVGDERVVRTPGARVRSGYLVHAYATTKADHDTASQWQKFFQRVSLYRLRPSEQQVLKILLLLPLAALIVSVFRTLIGIGTFGTFAPALLGIAFLDLRTLHGGLVVVVLIVLVGWWMRHALDRFHLLLVPRTSILLTLIVILLLVVLMVADAYNLGGMQYVALFPLVILTHLVERFWTIEVEDGTMASFKTLLGTLAVAVTVSVLLSPAAVTVWMKSYPETLLAVIGLQFLLGRYTGYRLTELYRFSDLLQDEPPPGDKP